MRRVAITVAGIVVLGLMPATMPVAAAGHPFHCAACGPGAGGSPYGQTGCGRRYWGAMHDECARPDPCDMCGRWRGCNGAMQGPEMLAPWQLPPGRGFMTAEQVGYDTRPSCHRCEYQFRVR